MIVADAGRLIAFARIGRLVLLRDVFAEIAIPSAVLEELRRGGRRRPGADEIAKSKWIRQRSLEKPENRTGVSSSLHAGEREAIALARQLDRLLLIDEHRGRRTAQTLGVSIIGSLGTLAEAKRRGLIDRARPILSELISSGYWIEPDLVDAFLSAVGEGGDGT